MTLDEIRALCEAATPGPWCATQVDPATIYTPTIQTKDGGLLTCMMDYGGNREDARLIAAARTLLPALLDVAEAAARLSDNINEFDTVTDNCFIERIDDALAALEALKLS